MKYTLIIIFVLLHLNCMATSYYVSANGSDSNAGTTTVTPIKTIAKANTLYLTPGDSLLFRRGDTFYGTLTISWSGNSGAHIHIGAYGTGQKPIITGFTSVTSWSNIGSGIYESSSAVSTLSSLNMVLQNGVNTPLGRWPNAPGDALFQSHVGDSIIVSDTVSSVGINFVGAEIVLSNTTYTVYRGIVTAQNVDSLKFSRFSIQNMWQSSGGDRSKYYVQRYIIQNDPRVCDLQEEWYYNSTTKKIGIKSSSQPTDVKVTTVEYLINIQSGKNYVDIENLKLSGANTNAIMTSGDQSNVTVKYCDIEFAGQNAIYGGQQSGGTSTNKGKQVIGCTINDCNNAGIMFGIGNTEMTISMNTIKNTGMFYGMLANGGSGIAITATGAKNTFDHNRIDSSGYIGIDYRGDSSVVSYNFVKDFCIREALKDGGAIYTWNQGGSENKGRKVFRNIVVATRGETGIYFDGGSAGVEVYENTVSGCDMGIALNSWNMNVHDNTFYDSYEAGILFRLNGSTPGFHDVVIKHNIVVPKLARSYATWFLGSASDSTVARRNMISDSNFYAKPMGNLGDMFLENWSTTYNHYSLAAWKSSGRGHDLHSTLLPNAVPDTSKIRLEYNDSDQAKTIALGSGYIDAKGATYPGYITLQPFASAVLIQDPSVEIEEPPIEPPIEPGDGGENHESSLKLRGNKRIIRL